MTRTERTDRLRANLHIARHYLSDALAELERAKGRDADKIATNVNCALSFTATCYRHACELAEADAPTDSDRDGEGMAA